MKPGKIKAIIEEKIKEIKKLSSKLNNNFDRDHIHEFRVAVKSFRSFLRLVRAGQNESQPKIPRKFKRLYHIAGAIRDAQLELEKLNEDKLAVPVYKNKLSNDIDRQKKEWERHYSGKVFRKMKEKLLCLEYSTLPPEALPTFFETKIAGVAKLSKPKNHTNSEIHNIRKKVKDIIYTEKLAKKQWKTAHKQTEGIPVEQLEEIAKMIGDYNDERIKLEHLASFSSPKLESDEKDAIMQACEKDMVKLSAEKKRIMGVVRKLKK